METHEPRTIDNHPMPEAIPELFPLNITIGTIEEKIIVHPTPIAKGGMGEIMVGWGVKTQKKYAVKAVSHDDFLKTFGTLSEDEQRSRWQYSQAELEREGVITQALNHPNIITCYGTVIGRNGEDHLVMEYLSPKEWGDLKMAREAGYQFPVTATKDILLQTVRGLRYAHQHYATQRDPKPANIMVKPPSNRESSQYDVKLIDFGVTELVQLDITRLTYNTLPKSDGKISGTHDYIAPEILFKSEGPSEQTMVYALGVISLEMMTGRRFYDFSNLNEFLQTIHSPDRIQDRVYQYMSALFPDDIHTMYRYINVFNSALCEKESRYLTPEAFVEAFTLAEQPQETGAYIELTPPSVLPVNDTIFHAPEVPQMDIQKRQNTRLIHRLIDRLRGI